VDPSEQLDEEVEEILLQIADDFIEQTVSQACALAKHRLGLHLNKLTNLGPYLLKIFCVGINIANHS
jgi:Transcription initiation factor TFIID subunit A